MGWGGGGGWGIGGGNCVMGYFLEGNRFAGKFVSQGSLFRRETRFTGQLVSQVTPLKLLSLYLW